jgi:hypothetical protein
MPAASALTIDMEKVMHYMEGLDGRLPINPTIDNEVLDGQRKF